MKATTTNKVPEVRTMTNSVSFLFIAQADLSGLWPDATIYLAIAHRGGESELFTDIMVGSETDRDRFP